MKIRVTRDDIRAARKFKGQHGFFDCPIALSVKRNLGEGYEVTVGAALIIYPYMCNGIVFNLPLRARGFIRNFDHGLTVTPFEFEVQ